MADLPTLHLIAPFHVRLCSAYSSCAFGQKAFKMSGMMQPFGWRVIEYANGGSESACEEKVALTTEKEFEGMYPRKDPKAFHGNDAIYGTPQWALFDGRLREQLAKRAVAGDLVLHPFGHAHRSLVKDFPALMHVESGIGYTDHPINCRARIYESSAWMHWHLGRYGESHKDDPSMNQTYSFVVPNSFDVNEWLFESECHNEDYVVFLARIVETKGTIAIAEIVRAWADLVARGQERPLRFVFAGQGNFEEAFVRHLIRDPAPDPKNYSIDYLGPVTGIARAKLVGRARCFLVASTFIEPFCGAAVEAMITGTPAIGPTFGAFCETVLEGVNGFRCRTLGDYLAAIRASKFLDRKKVSDIARSRYSLEAVGRQYDAAFREISDLNRKGWYTTESYRIECESPRLPESQPNDIPQGGNPGGESTGDTGVGWTACLEEGPQGQSKAEPDQAIV